MGKRLVVWISVVGSVLTIVGFVLQWVTPLRPMKHVGDALSWLAHAAVAVLAFGVPVWVLLSGFVAIVLLLMWLARGSGKVGVAGGPNVDDYTADEIFGVDWTWRWAQWGVHALTALCPTCKNELDWSGHNFRCSYCGKPFEFRASTSFFHEPGEVVKKEIRRRLRSGEWKSRLHANPGPG